MHSRQDWVKGKMHNKVRLGKGFTPNARLGKGNTFSPAAAAGPLGSTVWT